MMRNGRGSKLGSVMTAALVAGVFAAVTVLELRRPLRRTRELKTTRLARNLTMALLSAATVSSIDRPVVAPVARMVERRRLGVLFGLPLPAGVRDVLGVLLLDYTLYVWHVLLHRVPLLWRFHQVHHVDLDLDASTALRFHAGELALSVPYRLAQVVVIGISPRALATWQRLLFLSVLFHHSSVRLPIAFERALNRVIVTPRMHGIHHSIVPEETNSNWSSGLTIWDLLHRTARLNVPQQDVAIGVAAYRGEEDVRIGALLTLPFEPRQRVWWRLPTGDAPLPHATAGPAARLAP